MSKKIIKLLIFSIFLTIIFFIFKNVKTENNIKTISLNESTKESIKTNENINILNVEINENKSEISTKTKKTTIEQIPEEYKGYNVAARLEIPEINVKTYVLQNYSESALNISVTKYWGCNPNEIGNFCIAGHNWNVRNMFNKLKKLKIGNELSLTDNKNGKYNYKIYDIYKVKPNNVECLNEETNGIAEVTLITCTSDSKLRIIVKAKCVKRDAPF